MTTLGVAEDAGGFPEQIARVETELLWAAERGLTVPDYVARAFHEAVDLARERPDPLPTRFTSPTVL
jgi:hypothetical protein